MISLLSFQAFYRVGQRCFNGLIAHGKQGDNDGTQAGCHEDPA